MRPPSPPTSPAAGTSWQLAAGEALIHYGADRLTIENLPPSLESDPLLDTNRFAGGTTSLVELQRAAVEKAEKGTGKHLYRPEAAEDNRPTPGGRSPPS